MNERLPIKSLTALRDAEQKCTRCPLYKNATQVVPGEGPPRARIMLVGEQPGDQEDKQGKPFVGPAGAVLIRALEDAKIDRKLVFVTNAVKHFKFKPRGKRRLHKRPNAYELGRCHWWLDYERSIVRPGIIVALGATAIRSVSGRPITINKIRGRVMSLPDGGHVLATIHPSYILRIEDEAPKRAQCANAACFHKVSVTRDSGDCLVGPGDVARSLFSNGLRKGAGPKVPLTLKGYF